MAIKYTIPLLIPSAVSVFPSLSTTALHIAHWASAVHGMTARIKNSMKSLNLMKHQCA